MCLFGRQTRKAIPSPGSRPECLQQVGLGQAEARRLELRPGVHTRAGTQFLMSPAASQHEQGAGLGTVGTRTQELQCGVWASAVRPVPTPVVAFRLLREAPSQEAPSQRHPQHRACQVDADNAGTVSAKKKHLPATPRFTRRIKRELHGSRTKPPGGHSRRAAGLCAPSARPRPARVIHGGRHGVGTRETQTQTTAGHGVPSTRQRRTGRGAVRTEPGPQAPGASPGPPPVEDSS